MELRTYKTPRKSSRKIIIPTSEPSTAHTPSLINSSSEDLSPRAATRRQSAPHLSEAKRTNKRHTLAGSSSNTIINPNNDNANKYTTKRKGPMLSQSNPEIRTPPLHSKESSHETISLRVPSTSINRSSSLSPLPSRSTSPYASPISSTSISPTTSPRTPTRSNIEIIIDKIEETETLLNSLEVQLKCETLKRIEDEKRYSKQPFEQEMLDLESYKELSHRYSVVLEQLENNKETLSKLSGASSCPNSPLVPPVHRRGRSVTTYHLDKPAPVSQKRRTSSFGDAIATLKRDISSALAKSRNKDHKGGAAHADRADNAIHADHAGIKDAEHEERKEPEEHKGKGKHKESNHKERKENRKSPSIQIFDKESSEEMETQKNEDHVTPPSVSVEHFKQLIELKYQSENVQAPFLHNLRTKWRQYPIPD